jgi:hypothetical protein
MADKIAKYMDFNETFTACKFLCYYQEKWSVRLLILFTNHAHEVSYLSIYSLVVGLS